MLREESHSRNNVTRAEKKRMTENLMSGKHSDMDGINIGEGTGGQKIV